MIVDSVLVNAKGYIKGQIMDCSFAVEEGKIFKIGKETQMPNADKKINLRNLLVLPGLIDEHVHLRDQGNAYKEDFQTGTAAAAAGGFTTVLDMPNNEPVTMSIETLRNRMMAARRKVLVNVGFYSEFPKGLQEISGIVAEGAVAFKLFMGNQIGGLDINDDESITRAFEQVTKTNVPVAVHAEDNSMLTANEQKLKQEKKSDLNAFQEAHTSKVESKAIERLTKIIASTKVHLHICHISTREGLNVIEEAKKSGKPISCEVTPNHLFLSNADLMLKGQMLIMAPPLRSQEQVESLWNDLETGSIDTLGSDHAPHTLSEKSASSVWDVKVGVPGLETTLPLILTSARKGRILLSRAVELLAEKPAEIYGLKDCGFLEEGKNADLTVVDFDAKYKINPAKFKSKSKFSPYDGMEVSGKPMKTFVNGILVFDEGEIIEKPGIGSVIRRKNV